MKKQIPNIITLCNLACGVMATYNATFGRFEYAALFILLGIFFDFFDGLAARLLKVPSELGRELDSLADLVTSGVAPGFIFFSILWNHSSSILIKYAAFLIPIFAAYRLAKFNLDKRQLHSFRGLPAPANALLWVGIGLWFCDYNFGFEIIPAWHNDEQWMSLYQIAFSDQGYLILVVLSLLTNILLVSEIPMFSLKFNFSDLSWRTNWVQYIFIIVTIGVIAAFGVVTLPVVVLWYIIWSLCTLKKGGAHE